MGYESSRCRTWQEAKATSNEYVKTHPEKPGRPSADDKEAQKRKMYKETASNIKKSKYTLGKARKNAATMALDKWLWSASHSRILEICALCKKIRRHKELKKNGFSRLIKDVPGNFAFPRRQEIVAALGRIRI